ncbi:MAG: hypothetical protein IPP50_23225 [Piscinibacter sp.]|nr:hypothetical protein [Piscinibacter sp.]
MPFPPGGLTDVMARLVGQQLGERWKVPVNIDNKPGSGGQIGAAEVAKAPGDGQTLLAITMAHASNATLFKAKAPFDFAKDLKPVALLAGTSRAASCARWPSPARPATRWCPTCPPPPKPASRNWRSRTGPP